MAGRPAKSHGFPKGKTAAAALALIIVISAFPAPAAQAAPEPLDELSRVAGFQWGPVRAVTAGPASDTKPQVYAGADGKLSFFYQSSGLGPAYWFAQIGPEGTFTRDPTFITANVPMGWGDAYPMGPTIGIDSSSDIHVAYDDSWQNVFYMKFDSQGNVIVSEHNVGPADSQASHTPSLAVGLDDTIHIAHEEYRFQCEDIVYDKLDNDGNDIWIDRVVSSDVASHAEFSSIEVGRYDGTMLFSFGSATGTWVGRFDKYGVKNMQSVRVRNESDLKIVDMAGGPDGRIHLAWSQNGTVYYSAVNATGVLRENHLVVAPETGAAPGVARVEAMSDGRAAIVWDALVGDTRQIMISTVQYDASGRAVVSAPEALTNSTEGAQQPWLAIGPDDNPIVAYSEISGGVPRIHYRETMTCAFQIHADPITVSEMSYMHPNQTRVLPLAVRNMGKLTSDVGLDLLVDAGALARGWDVSISQSFFSALEPAESRNFSLAMRAPADAREGENISVEIEGHIGCDPEERDSISVPAYVKVTRALRLTLNPTLVAAGPGDEFMVEATVFNRGDTVEPVINLGPSASSIPAGWTVNPELAQVALGVGESASQTFTVTLPGYADAGDDPRIRLIAWAEDDSQVLSQADVRVGVSAQVMIELAAPTSVSALPAALAEATVEAVVSSNLGTMPSVTFESRQEGQAPWSYTLSKQPVSGLNPDVARAKLSVVLPREAQAGDARTFTVTAAVNGSNATDSIQITFTAEAVHRIEYGDTLITQIIVPGESRFADIPIRNAGNTEERLATSLSAAPRGWAVQADGMEPGGRQMSLAPGASDVIRVQISAPLSAMAGAYTVSLVSVPYGGTGQLIQFDLTVPPSSRLRVSVSLDTLAAQPGEVATYYVTVENAGNAPDKFRVLIIGIPEAFEVSTKHVWAPPLGQSALAESTFVNIGVGESELIVIEVTVPESGDHLIAQFSVSVSSELGATADALLSLRRMTADLVPTVIGFSPPHPDSGRGVAASVAVANQGDAPARNVLVEIYDNNQFVGRDTIPLIDAGEKAYVSIAWEPADGSHIVAAVVDADAHEIYGKIIESDETNNRAEAALEVGTPTPIAAGSAMFWLLGAAVAAGALIAVALWRRK